MMKCYDENPLQQSWKSSFNYSLIRTRHVVEQAFRRLKGRWRIIDKCNLNDPVFARRVALVCCALHNVCERHQCPFEDNWLPVLLPTLIPHLHKYSLLPLLGLLHQSEMPWLSMYIVPVLLRSNIGL